MCAAQSGRATQQSNHTNGVNDPEDNVAGSELFLVLKDLSTQVHSLLLRLERLNNAPEANCLLGVDALYRADKDQALLCLRYDPVLTPTERRQLAQLASQGGMPVLDPGCLSTNDQELFYQEHLARYAVRVDDSKTPHRAADALAQLLGLILPEEHDEETPVTNNGHRSLLLGRHHNGAKGSESEVDIVDLESMELGPAGKREVEQAQTPASSMPKGKRRSSERLPTIPARPRNARSRPGSTNHSEHVVQVRYERGDRWMPARLRNLTLKQVRLAASAAPPLGARIRVLLTLGAIQTTLTGTVVEVVNTESSVDGSTSFRVEFGELPRTPRQQLTTLLRWTEREGVTLSPPPARRNRRFAVTWPITVVSSGQRFHAEAHDVSERGLFLATTNRIRSRQVVFGIPLETNVLTIEGRAHIAREVDDKMAEERNLSQGYGLSFEPLSSSDQAAYESFLVRVKRRSQLHVLVAGRSEHNLALARRLEAAGYVVSLASSARLLERRRAQGTAGPDVVVGPSSVDTSWTSLQQVFEVNNVPVLHLSDQKPTTARATVDQLMNV